MEFLYHNNLLILSTDDNIELITLYKHDTNKLLVRQLHSFVYN
jgi:hypothetical protein